MTEYEEVTSGMDVPQLAKELDYQTDKLGFSFSDSFPSYLMDLLREKAPEYYKPGTKVIVNTGGKDAYGSVHHREISKKPCVWFVRDYTPMVRVKFENNTVQFIPIENIRLNDV